MTASANKKSASKTLHRPKASTVFAAAFLAGAAAAVAVNRAFDVHLAQSVPQVESEAIFVAIRSLPKGSPVNIYDVALKPWPTAMMPASAMRADATFKNMVLRHPVQEGQPILSLQLAYAEPEPQQQFVSDRPASHGTKLLSRNSQSAPNATPAFVPYSTTAPIPVAPASNKQASHQPEAPVAEQHAQVEAAEPATAVTTQPSPATATLAEDTAPQPAQDKPALVRTDSIPASVESVETMKPNQFAAAEAKPVIEPTIPATETATESAAMPKQIATQEEIAERESISVKPVLPEETENTASTELAAETPPTRTAPVKTNQPTVAAEDVVDAPEETRLQPTAEAIAEASPAPAISSQTPAVKAVEPIDVTASVLARADSQLATSPTQPSANLPAPTQRLGSPKTSPTTVEQQPMRYLVVPERIALQVDHSFTRHAPPPTTRQPTASKQNGGVKPLPNATAKSGSQNRPTPLAKQRSSATRSGQPLQQMQATAGSVPRANEPSATMKRSESRPTGQQTTRAEQLNTKQLAEQEPRLRAYFPNISAGLSAMSQEWREFRNRSNKPKSAPSSSRQAQRQGNQQPRSASRPQQSR